MWEAMQDSDAEQREFDLDLEVVDVTESSAVLFSVTLFESVYLVYVVLTVRFRISFTINRETIVLRTLRRRN
jgi:hypothetical protein